ncbi:rhomboid family intramembrane serine protease [Mucilaginibacter terrae]|uniref:rhomboid family intramembrane serine protease n=1 Tax=Mucilaginibacter terrae TaxID=1955052 RepID=UPI0036440B02
MQSPFSNLTPVVKNLLIINVIFFIATFALQSSGINLVKWLSAFYPASPFFKPWQIITYMFMHANIGHIFSNMLGLLFMGPIIEQTFGSKRFFNYYFFTGIGALALHFVVQAIELHQATGLFYINADTFDPQNQQQFQVVRSILTEPILGASGAVFGVLMAIFLLYPDLEFILFPIPIPVKVKYFVPVYVLYELFSGVMPTQGDSVAHFAHLGGALFGFILIKIWGYKKSNNFY